MVGRQGVVACRVEHRHAQREDVALQGETVNEKHTSMKQVQWTELLIQVFTKRHTTIKESLQLQNAYQTDEDA